MINLTIPIIQPSVVSVTLEQFIFTPEVVGAPAMFVYSSVDNVGNSVRHTVTMTGPAFNAAYLAASGGTRARLYAVLQGLLPELSGTVV